MTQELTTGLIGQLIEIDRTRAKKTGVGIYAEVSALVNRLTDGAHAVISDTPRIAQAKRLWDRGFGSELDFASFETYLESIPPVPEFPESYTEQFDRIVLVDARVNLERTLELLDIRCSGWKDEAMRIFTKIPDQGVGKVYWIRIQDGAGRKEKHLHFCYESFAEDETGLSILEGIAFFAQRPRELARRRRWCLFGSEPVQHGILTCVPCLDWSRNLSLTRPVLGLVGESEVCTHLYGIPSRGK